MVEKEKIVKESRNLYADIDNCITELLKARTEHNSDNEGKALFRMEGLMVATLQHLACIVENLKEPEVDLEEAARQYGYTYNADWPGQVPAARDGFIAGAEWKDKQVNRDEIFHDGMRYAYDLLMKEAVKGKIVDSGYEDGTAFLRAFIPDRGYDSGEWVKLIVIKED